MSTVRLYIVIAMTAVTGIWPSSEHWKVRTRDERETRTVCTERRDRQIQPKHWRGNWTENIGISTILSPSCTVINWISNLSPTVLYILLQHWEWRRNDHWPGSFDILQISTRHFGWIQRSEVTYVTVTCCRHLSASISE